MFQASHSGIAFVCVVSWVVSRVSNSERIIAPQSSCLYLVQTVHPLYVCLFMDRWRLLRWKHSLIAGTPLPFDGSPRLSIGVVVISGLDRDLAGYWCRSSMLAGTRDEDAYQCLRHLPFSTTLLEPEDRALQVWKVVVRVLDSNSV